MGWISLELGHLACCVSLALGSSFGAGPSDGYVRSGARSTGRNAQLGERTSNHCTHSGAMSSIESGHLGADMSVGCGQFRDKSPSGHSWSGN